MDIVKELRKAGFTRQADILSPLKSSFVRIVTTTATEDYFRVGESKIGGFPHLPSEFSWPMYDGKPLAFIAQFNLADIAPFDKDSKLPHAGILYFFYEGGEKVWGFAPEDKGGCRVIHYVGDLENLKITEPPDGVSEYVDLSPCCSFKLTQMITPTLCGGIAELFISQSKRRI
ncbi:hypothetical protein FACS1894188_04450 [Clostridia bacterium]|nr:hypothetical protein FACS1894188_04450 [Clostridia bacterium]